MELRKRIKGVGTKLQLCVILAIACLFAEKTPALEFEQFVDDRYTGGLWHFDDQDQYYYSNKWWYKDDNSNTGRSFNDLYIAIGDLSTNVEGLFGQACKFEPTVGATESLYTRGGAANGRTGSATNIVWTNKKSLVFDGHFWIEPTNMWGTNEATFIATIKKTFLLRAYRKVPEDAGLADIVFTLLDNQSPQNVYNLWLRDVPTSQWHRIRAVYSRGKMELTCGNTAVSMDGPEAMSTNSTATPGITAAAVLQIGYDTANRYFNGKMDEVRIGWLPDCGDWGYLGGDINQDCFVDFTDFAQMASNWLDNN